MISNLKLEFGEVSLDYIGGSPHRTRVVLKNDDGAYYPIFFEPDAIEKTDAELYQMALDVVYQKNSYQRAENEKFNTLGEKIAKYDELIQKANDKLKEMDKSLETNATQMAEYSANSEMAQATLLEIIGKLYEKGVLVDEELTETTNTEIS